MVSSLGRDTSFRLPDEPSEVDKNQSIGMTGTSGGSTQTTFLMALDDKIGPAAPSCYTMQRTSKFRGRSGPADGCQHLPFEGQYGIDHIDYTLMRAPKPTAILAATKDFFEIDSTSLKQMQSMGWDRNIGKK